MELRSRHGISGSQSKPRATSEGRQVGTNRINQADNVNSIAGVNSPSSAIGIARGGKAPSRILPIEGDQLRAIGPQLRVTVARPSDGPTDPSRLSRRADPALERETNKIIKDDRRGRFSSPHLLRVCEKQLTPNKHGRRSPPSAQRRLTSVFLRVAPATGALDGERKGCFSTPRPTLPTERTRPAVCDARSRVRDRRRRQRDSSVFKGPRKIH